MPRPFPLPLSSLVMMAWVTLNDRLRCRALETPPLSHLQTILENLSKVRRRGDFKLNFGVVWCLAMEAKLRYAPLNGKGLQAGKCSRKRGGIEQVKLQR